jgi:hypothetical protein
MHLFDFPETTQQMYNYLKMKRDEHAVSLVNTA